MAHDPELAARFRGALAGVPGISEKRMMGGVCFFLHGNMIGGADRTKDGEGRFMFRIGRENSERAADLGADGPMLLGDRVMRGFYFVAAARCDSAPFGQWMALALAHARSFPPK